MNVVESHGILPEQIAFIWNDTEGAEWRVLETGQTLWRAGVPIYLEVNPTMLRAQNGLEKFLELANTFFDRLISSQDLVQYEASAPFRPVAGLKKIIAGLEGHQITDVLLLPLSFDL